MVRAEDVILNTENPRIIRDDKFKKLVASIQEFPEMASIRPIVVDEGMIILGGNMRYRAMIDAGLTKIPVMIVEGLTPEQKKQFVIKDNASFGEWDWDMLSAEWDMKQLQDWGVDVPEWYGKNDIHLEEYAAPEKTTDGKDSVTLHFSVEDLLYFNENIYLFGTTKEAAIINILRHRLSEDA